MIRIAFAGSTLIDKILQKLQKEITTGECIFTKIYMKNTYYFHQIEEMEVADLSSAGEESEQFDYIMIADSCCYNDYYRQLQEFFDYKRILDGRKIVEYVGFDLKRFLQIMESEISIFSDTCWGGMLYHSLGMRMNTVLVNTSVEPEDYLELLSNLSYYLSCPMEQYKERSALMPPIGILGGKVKIMFNHYLNFQEGAAAWNRRLERINYNNLFIQMGNFTNYEQVKQFSEISIKNKVGFWLESTDLESICYLKQYEDVKIRALYMEGEFTEYLQNIILPVPKVFRPINVFKMLLGEKDFMRMK